MATRYFIGMTSWDPLVACGGKLAPFLLSIWNIPGKKCNRQLGLDVPEIPEQVCCALELAAGFSHAAKAGRCQEPCLVASNRGMCPGMAAHGLLRGW